MTIERGILLAAGLAAGAWALFLGFSLEWDLLNYHLYNPHALLHGRHAIDLAPAQMQTFLNPALQLPYYLLFAYGHSAVAVFVTGAIQGSQAVLLYLLLLEVVDRDRFRPWILILVTAMCLGGPVFLNQLGGSQGDTLLSLPVLGALLLVVRELKDAGSRRTLTVGVAAGFLLGVSVALKLTMAIYALALSAAAFLLFTGSRRWKIVIGLGLGGVLGVLVAGVPWFAWLWWTWESPLFPYFNDLFQSSWVNDSHFRDLRFMPKSLFDWVFYPWVWFFDSFRVWEFRFRDVRVPLLLTLAVFTPLFAVRWRRERRPELVLLWLFVIVSYLLWLRTFSIYRYLSVIEILAPLLLFATAVALLKSRRAAMAVLAVLVITQALVKFDRKPSTWEFQASAQTAASDLPTGTMLIAGGFEPIGYAAQWLDDRIPLVRIRSNFMHTEEPRHRLHALAHQRVRDHRGPLYVLLPGGKEGAALVEADLARLGLGGVDRPACRPFFRAEELQRLLGLMLCPVESPP